MNEKINNLVVLINAFQNITQEYAISTFPANNNTLTQFTKIRREHDKLNSDQSVDFNIFKYFRPDETMHSKLLAMLFNPNGEHGQDYLFIHSFLEKIGIRFDRNKDKWYITAEIGRIDILIRSSVGHVIIIENKSNWANDQDNQLYRYWYRAMYLPNKLKFSDPLHTLKNPEMFQIIYLVPNDEKIPEDISLKICKNIDREKDTKLPMKLEMSQIKQLTFEKDIVEWLEFLLPNFKSNHRLREYLLQYIETWKINY